jgi:arsenate reductase-like glutaredoxin family protein
MERPVARGELRGFFEKVGIGLLLDAKSKRFQELGLRHARMSDESWLDKLATEPLLLRMPLVRSSTQLSIGGDEAIWKKWMER